jgi:hypothetical protein
MTTEEVEELLASLLKYRTDLKSRNFPDDDTLVNGILEKVTDLIDEYGKMLATDRYEKKQAKNHQPSTFFVTVHRKD